jgi:hypothetical protein
VIAREVRTVQLRHGVVLVGQLACTGAPHPFIPDRHRGTSCLACYGWVDDPRHWEMPTPHGGAR